MNTSILFTINRLVRANRLPFTSFCCIIYKNAIGALGKAKAKCDKWHDYEMNVAPFEKDNPIYYEFTACPAAEFAKQFGLAEIMPALCNVDYSSMELIGAKLIRKGTCVDGDKCDYTICGDKDEFCKSHPEYIDEKGFRRNK